MTEQENHTETKLLQLIRAGDEDAFAALYSQRHRGIYRFALQMCGSQTLAEDVTQEVFLALLRDSHSFDPDRGSLSAFLFGMARNQLLRRMQRERFYAPIELDSDGTGEAEQQTGGAGQLDEITRTETIEGVRRAILSLPERYREVVVLCDLEEMSYVETAEALGCAIGTVRSRLHRARALLIEKLRPAEKSEVESTDVKSARCFA